jgi:hypothetical protein
VDGIEVDFAQYHRLMTVPYPRIPEELTVAPPELDIV